MKELIIGEVDKLLKKEIADKKLLGEEIDHNAIKSFLQSFIEQKAILGFDIYRYSQFTSVPQTLIPLLFKKLYSTTIKNCIKNEDFFFKNQSARNFEKQFIDTGDGGFQIFENPLEALIFAIYFQANIVRYNSANNLHSDLYNLIGQISLRYSLTYDNIYAFQNNFYGPAIINCARIMSKDKLNRFLLDSNSIKWFNTEINSIETCMFFNPEEDFPSISIFKNDFDIKTYKSVLFGTSENKIKCLDILKIGEIRSKLDILSIFSLHLQTMFRSEGKDFKKYNVTLGNLNSTGLSE